MITNIAVKADVIDLQKRASEMYQLGCKYLKKKNLNIALDIFKKIKSTWDNSLYIQAQLYIGEIYIEQMNYNKAIQILTYIPKSENEIYYYLAQDLLKEIQQIHILLNQ